VAARLVLGRKLLDVEAVAPADRAGAELGGDLNLGVVDGRAQGVLEQLAREPPIRWADLLCAVVGHPPVQADDSMQVHQAAVLVLRHLHVGHPDLLVQTLLGDPKQLGELSGEVDRRAAPQLAEQVVPHDGALVIEAVRAQRLPEARVLGGVHAAAGQRDAVAADRPLPARMAPERLTVRAEDVGVHDPERRCCERREERRVPGHGVGDAFAAFEAGRDEVVGVAAVALRARPADRLPPVAARLSEDPVRLAVGRPDLPAPAVPVADIDAPLQADGA
jgi:hypothetical protein